MVYRGPPVADCQSVASQGGPLRPPRWSGNGYHQVGLGPQLGLVIDQFCAVQFIRTLDSASTCHCHSSCRRRLCAGGKAARQIRFSPSFRARSCYYHCWKGNPHATLFRRGWRNWAVYQELLQAYPLAANKNHFYAWGSPVRRVLFETACRNCRCDDRLSPHANKPAASDPHHVGRPYGHDQRVLWTFNFTFSDHGYASEPWRQLCPG